ncbi:hypothetical protein BCR44DRAFT_1432984 [Catenaria anguillulae PL171]|uniref:Uncharacterized protein n=1 Tax=Catenaria anguillulae PL171 TaxID=765915 RepID=A0A1Y2HNP7_9FUNG|nr:hypothetical protein BCR44DRAFT_1432984 [Catenaria anguillulae PL171]
MMHVWWRWWPALCGLSARDWTGKNCSGGRDGFGRWRERCGVLAVHGDKLVFGCSCCEAAKLGPVVVALEVEWVKALVVDAHFQMHDGGKPHDLNLPAAQWTRRTRLFVCKMIDRLCKRRFRRIRLWLWRLGFRFGRGGLALGCVWIWCLLLLLLWWGYCSRRRGLLGRKRHVQVVQIIERHVKVILVKIKAGAGSIGKCCGRGGVDGLVLGVVGVGRTEGRVRRPFCWWPSTVQAGMYGWSRSLQRLWGPSQISNGGLVRAAFF